MFPSDQPLSIEIKTFFESENPGEYFKTENERDRRIQRLTEILQTTFDVLDGVQDQTMLQKIFAFAEAAAKHDIPWGNTVLGYFYETGCLKDIPRNINTAFACYDKAANEGNIRAMAHRDVLYMRGESPIPRDKEKAIDDLEAAAACDDPVALAWFGYAYEFGIWKNPKKIAEAGVSKPYYHYTGELEMISPLDPAAREAIKRQAAKYTFPPELEAETFYIAPDQGKAEEFYKRAIAQKGALGYAFYGKFLEKQGDIAQASLNFSVKQTAAIHYKSAAENYREGMKLYNMRSVALFGSFLLQHGTEKAQQMAHQTFITILQGAERFEPYAMSLVSIVRFKGYLKDYSLDDKKIFDYLSAAQKQREPLAFTLLGNAYNDQTFLPGAIKEDDNEKAIQNFRVAAENGNVKAWTELCYLRMRLLTDGLGFEEFYKNQPLVDSFIDYFKLAAVLNESLAFFVLAQLYTFKVLALRDFFSNVPPEMHRSALENAGFYCGLAYQRGYAEKINSYLSKLRLALRDMPSPYQYNYVEDKECYGILQNPITNQTTKICFNSFRVTADGKCGYTTLGIDPVQAARLLRAHSANATIRKIAGPEIYAAIVDVNGSIPSNMSELCKGVLEMKAAIGMMDVEERVEAYSEWLQYVQDFSEKEEVYLAFIDGYIANEKWKGGWMLLNRDGGSSSEQNLESMSKGCSFMDAIAAIKGIEVCVWSSDDEEEPEKLTLIHHFKPENVKNTIHMHLNPTDQHYNLLAEAVTKSDLKIKGSSETTFFEPVPTAMETTTTSVTIVPAPSSTTHYSTDTPTLH